jgi:hypothetical protein
MRLAFLVATRLFLLPALALTASCQPAAKSALTKPNQSAPAAPTATPTADDVRIGRALMPISEVVAELRTGVSRERVLDDVRRRHIATMIVDANELELAANGAGRELIAALKDPKNLPTPAQESAYVQLLLERQLAASKPKPARVTAR